MIVVLWVIAFLLLLIDLDLSNISNSIDDLRRSKGGRGCNKVATKLQDSCKEGSEEE